MKSLAKSIWKRKGKENRVWTKLLQSSLKKKLKLCDKNYYEKLKPKWTLLFWLSKEIKKCHSKKC